MRDASVQVSVTNQPVVVIGFDAVNYKKIWIVLVRDYPIVPNREVRVTLDLPQDFVPNFIETHFYHLRHKTFNPYVKGSFRFKINGQIYSPTEDDSLGRWQDPWEVIVPRDPLAGTHLPVKWDGPPVRGKVHLELGSFWNGNTTIYAKTIELLLVGEFGAVS